MVQDPHLNVLILVLRDQSPSPAKYFIFPGGRRFKPRFRSYQSLLFTSISFTGQMTLIKLVRLTGGVLCSIVVEVLLMLFCLMWHQQQSGPQIESRLGLAAGTSRHARVWVAAALLWPSTAHMKPINVVGVCNSTVQIWGCSVEISGGPHGRQPWRTSIKYFVIATTVNKQFYRVI